jgi:hypothetical protein
MVSVVRIIGYVMLGVLCVTAAAIGIASIRKYREDRDRYQTILSYTHNATCNLTSTFYLHADGDCVIQGFLVRLNASGNWTSGYYAYSNFFPNICGGVIFQQNVSTLPNVTLVPCWYAELSDPVIRLVPTSDFAPAEYYLYLGTALVIAGIAPPTFFFTASCCFAIAWASRLYRRRRRSNTTRRANSEAGSPGDASELDETPPQLRISELRPSGPDWTGRLICVNEFANAAAKRLEDVSVMRREECPLCFRSFGTSVVWWTCGHCVCDDCIPKVLDAEKRWGHTNNPRCPLCRERSDIGDIVKITFGNAASSSSSEPIHEDDASSVAADHVNVWAD